MMDDTPKTLPGSPFFPLHGRPYSGDDLPPPATFFTVEDDAVAVGRDRADRARHMAMKRKEFRKIRLGVVAVVVGSLALWAALWAGVSALSSLVPL
jgi:hypothetical protein